jgi:hypothetical protein
MDDVNVRNVQRMAELLASYKNGQIDLPWLISGLGSLASNVELFSPAQRLDFRKAWGRLEEVYAFQVTFPDRFDKPTAQALIDVSLAELEVLLVRMGESEPPSQP